MGEALLTFLTQFNHLSLLLVFICTCVFWTYHEGVLHSDDGTVQDGWRNWGDLQQLPLPALALPLGQRVPPKVGYQLLDLLALPLGEEGLGLVESGFGHNHPG